MSPIKNLKEKLTQLSVKLYLEGDNLRVNAPKNALTPDIMLDLKNHKQELLAELKGGVTDIVTVPIDLAIPLSTGQKRLWSLIELQQNRSIYNVPMVHNIKGLLSIEKLKKSLTQIQLRHSILRTSINVVNGKPYLKEMDIASIDIRLLTLDNLSTEHKNQEFDSILNNEIQHHFDLNKAPLWRCTLIKLSQNNYILAITMHHIICDLFSKKIFLQEIAALYNDETLEALTIQYKDYAYWQQSESFQNSLKSQLNYWQSHLQGQIPELLLPTDHPRAASLISKGDSFSFSISKETTRQLNQFCRSESVSLHMFLLTAFNILLNRYSEQTDQIICSPFACRNKTSIEGLIGYFNNILPLRTDLSGNPTFKEILIRVRKMTINASKYQNAPFMQISELKSLQGIPITKAMFNFRMGNSNDLSLNNLISTPIENRRNEADFDLALYMGIQEKQLCGVLDYNSQTFNRNTISLLTQQYEQILESFLEDPEQRLNNFPLFRKQFSNIENIIKSHPKVDDALVVIRSDVGQKSNKVVYLLLNEHDTPSLEELNIFIQKKRLIINENIALLPIDYFPLHIDGSVDLNSLPAPKISRKLIDTEYVEPQSILEIEIANIWQRILWMDEKIGIHDNFFDLGGHSLLSVQMVVELEKYLNRPISGLNQLSTVANLASSIENPSKTNIEYNTKNIDNTLYRKIMNYTAAWSGKRSSPESLIVGLNTDGSKQAVFWCVQRYMNIVKIADGLGPDQPLYGMRSGHSIMEQTKENIHQLALYYVDEVLKIQSSGPFILGGICQAAEIAFQIAIRLKELGHDISLLGLQERFIRQYYPGPIAFFFGDESNRSPYYHFQNPELGWRKYYTGSIQVKIMKGKHGTYFSNDNISSLTQQMQEAFDQIESNKNYSPNNLKEIQILAEDSYRAKIEIKNRNTTDRTTQVLVKITNKSPSLWKASKISGVYLGARWLDPLKYNTECYTKHIHVTEIRASLNQNLEPEDSIVLMLNISSPNDANINILEIDMVDEGITWFADKGSNAVQINF